MKTIIKYIIINLLFIDSTAANAKLFMLVGPSGVGKSAIISKLKENGFNFKTFITHTTRAMRAGEAEGKDYFFISKEEYKKRAAKDGFLLPNEFYGNNYGIDKEYLYSELDKKYPLMCAISFEIAPLLQQFLLDQYQEQQAVTIFVRPPSKEELIRRLLNRGTENEESLKKRLSKADEELAHQNDCNYIITNDNLDIATEQIKEIIEYNN